MVSSANLMMWLLPCMSEQSSVNREYSWGLMQQHCGAPVLRTRVDEVFLGNGIMDSLILLIMLCWLLLLWSLQNIEKKQNRETCPDLTMDGDPLRL